MEVYRLTREKHAAHLSGIGAALRGARWNSVGVELLYTACNRSLAMAEVAVHLSLAALPPDYLMLTLDIPDDIPIEVLPVSALPTQWNVYPPHRSTQILGDQFVKKGESAVLKVPSVVTQGDFNYLLNPLHADFQRIRILHAEPFLFDKRIFKI